MARETNFIDELFDLASAKPELGLRIAGVLVPVGAVLYWLLPKGNFLAPLLGMACWVFAFALLPGSLAGHFQIGRRQARLDRQRTVQDLHDMGWREFEFLVSDTYKRMGYAVQEGPGQRDGGIDLVLSRSGATDKLVQCKQYRSWKVGAPQVREFYGAMMHRAISSEGIFVTCGSFTEDAKTFAEGKPIELIDGEALLSMILRVNGGALQRGVPSNWTIALDAPGCPKCGQPMVVRTAKRGGYAGSEFWGCSRFPSCRGKRNL